MRYLKMFEYFVNTDTLAIGDYVLVDYKGNLSNPNNDEIVDFVNNNVGVITRFDSLSGAKNEYVVVKYDVPPHLIDNFINSTIIVITSAISVIPFVSFIFFFIGSSLFSIVFAD